MKAPQPERRLSKVNAVPEHPDWHYGLVVAHGEGIISVTLYGPDNAQLDMHRHDTNVMSKHAEADRLITAYEAGDSNSPGGEA